MAINEGTVESEMPPESLAKSLQPSKPSLKNPLREKSSTKPDSDNTQTVPPPSPYSHYPPYSYPGYPPYFPPPASHHQQALYPHNMQPWQQPPSSHQQPTQTVVAPNQIVDLTEPASSPPSDVDKLTEYMNWLITKYPALAEDLIQCKEALTAHKVIWDTLFKVTDELFMKWNVDDGIVLLIREQKGKWNKSLAKK